MTGDNIWLNKQLYAKMFHDWYIISIVHISWNIRKCYLQKTVWETTFFIQHEKRWKTLKNI